MIRDITIGRYINKESFVHSLDARTKILCSLLFMFAVFLLKSVYEFIWVFLLIILACYFSKIAFKNLIKGLRSIYPLIVFSSLMNMSLIKGVTIFHFGFIDITFEGLLEALFMVSRIVSLIMSTSILSLTTSPINLTNGIERLLSPFKIIKIPSHEIAMMMSIALRFIPTLINEIEKIIKAQKSRGADFESGSIFRRIKSFTPVLIPLFINSFSRADELAMSMEARCYKGDIGRTKFKELKFRIKDYLILGFFLIILIFLIIRFHLK